VAGVDVSPPVPGRDTLALVADLHLGAGDGDPFTEDDRFAAAVEGLVAGAAGGRFRLVLLGDTVDFPAVRLPGRRVTPATSPDEAIAKLDRVLTAHPAVVDALRGVLAAGHRVDLVAGNHDMEFVLPGVRERLQAAFGGGPDSVRVHPWLLYEPGVLYAEHGQQQHDVNRFPELGGCACTRGRLTVPAGSYLDSLVHLRDRQPDARVPALAGQAARMGVGLVTGLVRLSRAERHRSRREPALAGGLDTGLSPAAVLGIDRASAATPGTIARRAAALVVAHRSAGSATPYMLSAARSVHRVLAGEGCAVPFYVFGHTHLAADVPLGDGETARYLNPGTWSSMVRRVPGGDRRFGVVVIEREPGAAPWAELRVPA
jgi:UDP-2,3-diacylglucosamine pyrophosphatase LpxH